MVFAIITDGIVSNIVEAEAVFAAAQGWVAVTSGVGTGWTYDGSTFSLPVVSFEDQRTAKIAAVNAKVAEVLSSGFTVPSGVMAGEVLQTRNLDDRTNWLVSQASYSVMAGLGNGAELGAKFRSADNDTFTMSYTDGLNVLMTMAAWGAAAMDNSWSLKDAIKAAEDQTALDAIDIDAGWPS